MDRGNGSKSDTTVKSLYFLNSLNEMGATTGRRTCLASQNLAENAITSLPHPTPRDTGFRLLPSPNPEQPQFRPSGTI
jgi:hypothetical protein